MSAQRARGSVLLSIWSEAATGPERYLGVDGKVYYSEALEVGYRWYQAQDITPLFPFGFGLSYTTFTLDEFSVTTPTIEPGFSVSLQVRVTNAGDREGAEVVQAYVVYPIEIGEPPKQLRAFQKVTLLLTGVSQLRTWTSQMSMDVAALRVHLKRTDVSPHRRPSSRKANSGPGRCHRDTTRSCTNPIGRSSRTNPPCHRHSLGR